MLTVLARMKKDRERVRMYLFDAFYCLGRSAIPVTYSILSIWPEVFPMHGTLTPNGKFSLHYIYLYLLRESTSCIVFFFSLFFFFFLDDLPNCLAHLIRNIQGGNEKLMKFLPLKKMITNYYQYPQDGGQTQVVMEALLQSLRSSYFFLIVTFIAPKNLKRY